MNEDAQMKGNILWVEDVPKSIRANVYHLERCGFYVTVVLSLEQAIEATSEQHFDVVIVDYSIPEFQDNIGETTRGLGLKFIRMLKTGMLGRGNAAARVLLCTAQRESIGADRQELDDLSVEILAKSSSYASIVKLADEIDRAA